MLCLYHALLRIARSNQIEVHRNGRFHLDRFSIEEIRAVAPLLHRVAGCWNQVRVPGYGLELDNTALFINDGM